jgi:2'-5' RNA ligase
MRLFVGLALPDTVRDRLSVLYGGVDGARWISKENLHLTLHFLGEVDRETAEDVNLNLSHVEAPAFPLSIGEVGYFGKTKGPRALWAGVSGGDDLMLLRGRVGAALERAGIKIEGRKYKPHITLARLKNVKSEALVGFLENNIGLTLDPFPVESFTLFRSHLGNGGSYYEPLAEYKLL